ncbi:hypothetical protein KJ596_00970 [Patescibacteria group bacterium]|nr:hypothetical protein [Patescibacteria group bacterium]MBU1868802.1 hypothetical protein [Patescibacteria group bacterium]
MEINKEPQRKNLLTTNPGRVKVSIKILIVLILAVITGIWGFAEGKSSCNKIGSIITISPTPIKDIEYRQTRYGHMATGLTFPFEYPLGWHVEMFIGETQEDIFRNRIRIDPNPLTSSDYVEVITGTELGESVDESYYALRAAGQIKGEGELASRNFEKKDFDLYSQDDFCYSYDYYDIVSVSWKNIIDCVIIISAENQMRFKLNSEQYLNQFQHFIESVNKISAS